MVHVHRDRLATRVHLLEEHLMARVRATNTTHLSVLSLVTRAHTSSSLYVNDAAQRGMHARVEG